MNIRQITGKSLHVLHITFNVKTDMDIIMKLNEIEQESGDYKAKSKYIKALIRDDMKNN